MRPLLHKEDLSVVEAARAAGCHPQTIYRRVADGSLPAHRVGPRSIRIKRSDLNKLVSPIGSETAGEEPTPIPDPIREAALRVVAEAPKLTGEQLDKICALLRGAA